MDSRRASRFVLLACYPTRSACTTWSTGDWDGDREFTTSDLVLAFQSGAYVVWLTWVTRRRRSATPFLNGTMETPNSLDDPVSQLTKLSRKPGCTVEEIKAAYLRFAEQLHPDRGGNAEQFRRLQKEYEAAQTRLERGYVVPAGSKPFVPWPVEPRFLTDMHVIGGLGVLLVLVLIGCLLPPGGLVAFGSLIISALILVLLPMILASSGSRVVALILVVVIPLSLASVVVLSQSDAVTRMSEGRDELGDMVVASLVMPAISTLLASMVGLLFWWAGDRN